MPLREASFADLVPAAKVLAAAFKDESLHGDHFHPYRKQYPNDMYLYFLRKLRLGWANTPVDHRIVLACNGPEAGDSDGLITGVAIWERKRATPKPQSWSTFATVKSMEWYNYLESLVYPNRAAEPTHLSILANSDPFVKHHWTGTRAESWYLDLIGVDPVHGGKGQGRQLVAWGRERAIEEGIGASLVSADGRERFYQACGFDIVGMAGDEGGEANEISKIPGGAIFFWDNGVKPEGIKKYGEK